MVIREASLETVCGITSTLPANSAPEVAFAGKSNVGKSSLINALLNRKALARTSGYKAPVVIDTPMARLDSSHRANFVTRYLPAASSQVLVLSTDEEIYGRYLDMIRENVADSFTLLYQEDEQCTTIAHGYFGEA